MQRNQEESWDALAPHERGPEQWYAAARRSYVEEHQGCPHCRGRHCVFRSQWGTRIEYHCMECDFSAAHDGQTGRSCVEPGRPAGLASLRPGVGLMLELGGTS